MAVYSPIKATEELFSVNQILLPQSGLGLQPGTATHTLPALSNDLVTIELRLYDIGDYLS